MVGLNSMRTMCTIIILRIFGVGNVEFGKLQIEVLRWDASEAFLHIKVPLNVMLYVQYFNGMSKVM